MALPTELATDLLYALDPARFMAATGTIPDSWQADLLRSVAPQVLLLCSRQSGKSSTCALLALHQAIYQPGNLILLLSPSLRQSQELFKKVQNAYRLLPTPPPLAAESALRYELANGSRILALPGIEGTVRGYSGVNLLVIDEAARVADALYYSVRPMLAVSGGRLIALSTPWGKRGWFFQEWTGEGEWERFKITAHDCPRISQAFLDDERRSMPAMVYVAEYECAFTDVEDSVFAYEDVQAAVSGEVEPLFGAEC
jgi:hypothetical protein